MKLGLFLIFSLTQQMYLSEQNCVSPIVNIRSTGLHQIRVDNARSKRATARLRIHRYYDRSFDNLSNKNELKAKILEPAIRFWEDSLLVKNPTESPILLDRECTDRYKYDWVKKERIKVCEGQCVMNQSCHTTVIPNQFLAKCYILNDYSTSHSIGEDGKGAENSDLIIIITHKSDSCGPNTLAYATACELEYTYDRPVLGLINLCPGKLNSDIHLNSAISTVKHEIVHILGFSPTLFPFFRDQEGNPMTPRDDNNFPNLGLVNASDSLFYKCSNNTIITKTYPVTYRTGTEQKVFHLLVTPTVKKVAQKHFNCPSLEGVLLEDYGVISNSLSHFEKKILQNELMTPSISSYAVTSVFTLALLQDTGWYDTDTGKAETFTFAKDVGCDFIYKSCYDYMKEKLSRNESIRPYCNEIYNYNSLKCSDNLKYLSFCNLQSVETSEVPLKYRYFRNVDHISIDPYSDYCPYHSEFLKTRNKKVIHNGICTDSQNNIFQNTKYNFFAENFGPNSTCVQFDSSIKWCSKSCDLKSVPSVSGAGCYTYLCSLNFRLIIEVNKFQYQCLTDGQVLNINSRSKYSAAQGRLVCPRCSLLCNKAVCDSTPSILPTRYLDIGRQCPDMSHEDIPCSCLSSTRFLYLPISLFTIIYFLKF